MSYPIPTENVSIPTIAEGQYVPSPERRLWGGVSFYVASKDFHGHQISRGAAFVVRPNQILCTQVVSAGSERLRGLIVSAYDCLLVNGAECVRSVVTHDLIAEQEREWRMSFVKGGANPSVIIEHSYALKYMNTTNPNDGPQLCGVMIEEHIGHGENLGVEIEARSNGTIRLHFCEGVSMQDQEYVLLDALVVDVWAEGKPASEAKSLMSNKCSQKPGKPLPDWWTPRELEIRTGSLGLRG